ncbi:hypothetical protein K1719_037609 [Acacia pycnantha]|nr:hypothetical protein K1719_037609 [Acacia pycnantha]
MEESQSQLELYVGDCRDTRIIGKIRDFLFSQASGINPSVIERRIQELFPSFETPTHSPYALMIQKAVKVLNERNGSTEEAISGFIKNEFQDLPWAHSRILDLHLGKLCKAGELLRTARGRYMLMEDYNRLDEMKETRWRGGRRRKKYKRGRTRRGRDTLGKSEGAERCNKLHERENEEQNHLSELHGTGTCEPIEKQGNSEISQLGVTEVGHGQVIQEQGGNHRVKRQNQLKRNYEHRASYGGKKEFYGDQIAHSLKKQPDNLRGDETLERSKSAERCNELQERENEEQNRLFELHCTGANEMIEEQGKFEIGQRGVTEECHGRMVQGQGETQQNENTNEREKQIEATTKISRFCSDEISNNEKLSASLGSPTVAENQCENLPDNLLVVVEHQSLTQQIEATTEMSRFCSDDISNNENSFADYQEVALLPSDGSIVDKQKPKYYKMKKQLQLRPQGRGIGRGRRRCLKLDRNLCKHKKLQLQDQTLTSVSFPSLEPNETVYSLPAPTSEESPSCITRGTSQLQLFLQMSWERLVCGDLGTTSKMEDSLSSMNCLEHKPQQHGNKRGPKRKLNLDGKTEFGHLEQQSPKRRRRGRPPNPVPTQDHQWSWVAVEHSELQSSGSIEGHCEQTQRKRPKLKLDANGSCRNQMVLPCRSSKVQGRRELLQLKLSNAYESNELSPETWQSQGKRLLRSSLSKSR